MNNKVIALLTNPFENYSAKKLCYLGITAYLLSSILAYYSFHHFQGILRVTAGANASLSWSFYNNACPIVLLTLAMFVFGRLKNGHIRMLDILNVVLISRIIIYGLLTFLVIPFSLEKVLLKVEFSILDDDFMLSSLTVLDWAVLLVSGLFSLLCLTYFFYFFIKGIRFVVHSKSKLDGCWILVIIFGLEIAFILFGINKN